MATELVRIELAEIESVTVTCGKCKRAVRIPLVHGVHVEHQCVQCGVLAKIPYQAIARLQDAVVMLRDDLKTEVYSDQSVTIEIENPKP